MERADRVDQVDRVDVKHGNTVPSVQKTATWLPWSKLEVQVQPERILVHFCKIRLTYDVD